MTNTPLMLLSDSYKVTHHKMLQDGITGLHSYFEARSGATHEKVMFFGLQALLLEHLVGTVVTNEQIDQASEVAAAHLGPNLFNEEGWRYIANELNGKLPIRIRAVKEGTIWAPGTVLMTVENTDPRCAWLVNYLETVLSQIWYPCTVGAVSWSLRREIEKRLVKSTGSTAGVEFMLHDFGCRGVSSMQSAAIGGLAHLVSFWGTDTMPALWEGKEKYNADLASLGFSVPASEHSVMTARGGGNDIEVLDQLLERFPTGILSVVADSFNVYSFVKAVCDRADQIKARDGKVVVRPDSNTKLHPNPADQVVWILNELASSFDVTRNEQGYIVLDKVGVLWGDGIGPDGILAIIDAAMAAGYAASNLVFGMGGGLLQKVNRDTERFAFKASAVRLSGDDWKPISKRPLDSSKASKAGRFDDDENLHVVFENGDLVNEIDFQAVRANAQSAAITEDAAETGVLMTSDVALQDYAPTARDDVMSTIVNYISSDYSWL